MVEETTTEQLAEIEGQAEQPPQPQPIQVREGRWRTRDGNIRNVTPTPEGDGREHSFPWWDAQYRQTWTSDGRYHSNCEESPRDLVKYLGPIEEQSQPEPQPQPEAQAEPEPEPESDAELRIRLLKQANDSQAETIGRLLTEARDLNMEIGGLERQLLQRDARIRDLETMHAAAAQAVVDAGKQNDALRAQVQILQQEASKKASRIEFLETLNAGNGAAIDDYRAKVEKLQGLISFANQQLEAAATERDELRIAINQADKQLDQKDAQIRDLRIELDAAQQVPVDSPELRQLRADLAEVTLGRDTYRDGYDRVLSDLVTARKTAKAEAVEAIVEWLVPIRTCGSQALATAVISNLPHIMRSLTGLEDEEIE